MARKKPCTDIHTELLNDLFSCKLKIHSWQIRYLSKCILLVAQLVKMFSFISDTYKATEPIPNSILQVNKISYIQNDGSWFWSDAGIKPEHET